MAQYFQLRKSLFRPLKTGVTGILLMSLVLAGCSQEESKGGRKQNRTFRKAKTLHQFSARRIR
ncbi:hypothetical protein [Paenibacillus guangzhouensis]|uniref:hypothetical protein n=1 Tax=Paenibacillus guangzhouensis TaxID=1473112 RepID=UPI001D0FA102|nr:hypothetical protein [Paenibacillus guangzhouensis]